MTVSASALAAILDIAASLSTERNLTQLLGRVIAHAQDLTGSRSGLIYLLDRLKQYLVPEIIETEEGKLNPAQLANIPLYTGGGRNDTQIATYAIFNGRIVMIDDVSLYSGLSIDPIPLPILANERRTAILAAPLAVPDGLSLGVLLLVDPKFNNDNRNSVLSIIRAFTAQAAIAVENTQLASERQTLINELARTNARLEQENKRLQRVAERSTPFIKTMVGSGAAMTRLSAMINRLRGSDVTVLIEGETGTGKELLAAHIHRLSPRSHRSFIAQNCAALPEALLESEFFGHLKGAFTGAGDAKIGLFEAASGGTLFLDEIGDMPLGLQGKILRVLQEGEIRPIGSLENRKVDVRVIAATHRDLKLMIKNGDFREDLYYRLAVFPLLISPLRERKDDIPTLIQHFLTIYSEKYDKTITGFTNNAFDSLISYHYPGNIPELSNIIERAILLSDSGTMITSEHLPIDISQNKLHSSIPLTIEDSEFIIEEGNGQTLRERVHKYESLLIRAQLSAVGGNQSQAARDLGISRRALIDKLGRYKILVKDEMKKEKNPW